MDNGKLYQCHMAASCTYHRPTVISCCSTTAEKSLYLKEKYRKFSGEKNHQDIGPLVEKKTERATGLGRRTKDWIEKRNQVRALRFQTGEWTSDIPRPLFEAKIIIKE